MNDVRFLKLRRSKPYKKLKILIFSVRAYLLNKIFPFSREIPKDPIFIFNHIPKCGGSSLKKVLEKKFRFYPEYPPHEFHFKDPEILESKILEFKNNRINHHRIKPWQLISGHYQNEGYKITQRFPDLYTNPRIQLITFLRDPLLHRLSMYVYSKKKDLAFVRNLEIKDYVFKEINFYGKALDCNIVNYKEVMDNYFFIGITEQYKESLSQMKNLLNLVTDSNPPHVNITNSISNINLFTEEDISQFKSLNQLDYCIYNYGIELLNKNSKS